MSSSHLSRVPLFFVAAVMFFLPAAAQDTTPRLTFDVATIRPSTPGQTGGGIKGLPGGGGYTAKNIPVRLMISLMYRLPYSSVKGGPNWLDDETFDVEARTDQPHSLEELHTMYQNLLADRFHLQFHWETKEGPVYAMTLAPGGLKMTPNNTPEDYKVPLSGGGGHITGTRVSMKYLCWWLGQVLDDDKRPVINLTGLDDNGYYDFKLDYAIPAPPGVTETPTDLPSLFEALPAQLGIKLHAETGPIKQIVIDHVEKPSDN